jgi:hypothetical protein
VRNYNVYAASRHLYAASRHLKDTGELALVAITGGFAEFLSVPRCLGFLRGTKVESPAGPSLQIVVAREIQPSIRLAQGPHRDKRFAVFDAHRS